MYSARRQGDGEQAGKQRKGDGMRNRVCIGLVMAATALGLVSAANAGVTQRIGVGANYCHTIEEIKESSEFNQDGISWYASYQLKPVWLLFFEAQLEQMPDGFMAAPERVYAPQAYAGIEFLFVYAAVGVGKYYTDGDWISDPFYNLRAGLNLGLLPFLKLDIYGAYRFSDWKELDIKEDVKADTVTLGAALRLEF